MLSNFNPDVLCFSRCKRPDNVASACSRVRRVGVWVNKTTSTRADPLPLSMSQSSRPCPGHVPCVESSGQLTGRSLEAKGAPSTALNLRIADSRIQGSDPLDFPAVRSLCGVLDLDAHLSGELVQRPEKKTQGEKKKKKRPPCRQYHRVGGRNTWVHVSAVAKHEPRAPTGTQEDPNGIDRGNCSWESCSHMRIGQLEGSP